MPTIAEMRAILGLGPEVPDEEVVQLYAEWLAGGATQPLPGTPAELKALIPAFAAVPDATVQVWLNRAARIVDASWAEADQQHAQILLAAHYMTLNGLGTGAEAELAASGTLGFKSMKSGALSLDRGDSDQFKHMGEYGTTAYGRQFWPLLKANKGGPLITGTGRAIGGCGLDPRIPRWPAGC